MEFHALLDFIRTHIRMAHIYQPVMIRTLLDHRRKFPRVVGHHSGGQVIPFL